MLTLDMPAIVEVICEEEALRRQAFEQWLLDLLADFHKAQANGNNSRCDKGCAFADTAGPCPVRLFCLS